MAAGILACAACSGAAQRSKWIKRAIRKYCRQMGEKDKGYRSGVIFRSRREEVGAWTTLVLAALCFGVMAIPDFSVLLTLAADIGIATLVSAFWFAWIAWGRDRFPLRKSRQPA